MMKAPISLITVKPLEMIVFETRPIIPYGINLIILIRTELMVVLSESRTSFKGLTVSGFLLFKKRIEVAISAPTITTETILELLLMTANMLLGIRFKKNSGKL